MGDTSQIYRYLPTFLAVAENMSFSHAARALRIAQPAVTRQIKLLEGHLGVSLFIRSSHTVILTPEGTVFLQQVKPLATALETSLADLENNSVSMRGHIRIGCLREIGEHMIAPQVMTFWRKYPDMVCHISYMKAFEIEEQIRTGALDFGIVPYNEWPEGLRGYDIYEEESVLVTRFQNSRNLTRIDEARFVAYREGDPLLTQYLRAFHPKLSEAKINIAFTVNSQSSMVLALQEADLYAVLPSISVQKALRDKSLRLASPAKMSAKLYLLTREDPLMEKRKQVFMTHMLALRSKGTKRKS